jgi:RNA polymerase sigma factor (sigma-70 family)
VTDVATSPISKVIDRLRRAVLAGEEADLTDGQLLECFVSRREEAAVAALVRRHGPMVWGVCRRVLRNHHDAEDAFQATFLVLVRRAASVVPREMVANWLYGVAHQTALKAKATAAKRQTREKQVNEMPEPEAVTEPDLWRDLQPLLDQELSHLPDKYRVAIVLCDLEGKARKEVARQLRVPEGTLSSRLTTARTMLAKRLARHGLPVSGGALAAVLSRQVASACVPASVVSGTIKAASLFAAGRAGTAGVTSARVAALTEGVVKSMSLTKLKIAPAVLLAAVLLGAGAGLSGRPDPLPVAGGAGAANGGAGAKKPPGDEQNIQRTWIPVALEMAGKRLPKESARRLLGDAVTFAGDEVTFRGRGETMTFRIKPSAKPKAIDFLRKDGVVLAGIYELRGDQLKLCVCNDPAGDRPKEFSGQAPGCFLAVCQREVTDLEKIQGAWKANDGQGLLVFKGTKVTIKNRFVYEEQEPAIKNGEGQTLEGTFTLDPERVPRAITITLHKPKCVLRGIYIVDGDHLQVRLAARGQERPASWFGEGSGGPLYVFTLTTPKGEQAGAPNREAPPAAKADGQPQESDRSSPIRLEIALEKAEYAFRAAIPLTITYTNISKEAVELIANGTAPGEGFPGETFEITSGAGRKTYTINATDPQEKHVRLKPGESWKRTIKDLAVELSGTAVSVDGRVQAPDDPLPDPFGRLDDYTIRLRYDSTVKNQPAPRFNGRILSNAVKLRTVRR